MQNKNNTQNNFIAYIEILLVTIIWGGSMVSSKLALQEFSPSFIVAVRYLCGSLLIALIFFKHMKNIELITIKFAGLTGGVMYISMMVHLYSLQYTTAAHQSFILVLYTVIVPLLEWIFLKKRPPSTILPAVIIIIAGVALISINNTGSWSYGDLIAVLFAILYSIQLLMVGIHVRKCDVYAFTAFMLFTTGILSLITCLFMKSYPHTILKCVNNIPAIAGLVYLTILNTAIAFLLQCHAQNKASSTILVLIMSLESVFGAVAAYLFLHEKFTFKMLIGSVLVIVANLLVVLPKKTI